MSDPIQIRDGKAVEFTYRNHRGEVQKRCVQPRELRFGECEWHIGEQWLLVAFDLDRTDQGYAHRTPEGYALRTFAVADILEWHTGSMVLRALCGALAETLRLQTANAHLTNALTGAWMDVSRAGELPGLTKEKVEFTFQSTIPSYLDMYAYLPLYRLDAETVRTIAERGMSALKEKR